MSSVIHSLRNARTLLLSYLHLSVSHLMQRATSASRFLTRSHTVTRTMCSKDKITVVFYGVDQIVYIITCSLNLVSDILLIQTTQMILHIASAIQHVKSCN